MDFNKEFFASLALRHTPRLGPKVWKQLLAHFDSVYDVVQAAPRWSSLPLLPPYAPGMAKSCINETWRPKAEHEYKAAIAAGMDVLTWFDPRFPQSLRDLEDPPLLLYVSGDISLLRNPGVAVVGARECTHFGLETAGRISTQLAHIGVTVVSGLALGIDRQAHMGGLRGIGRSVAVLGCGLDIDYPYDNLDVRRRLERDGLVVTEYGPGIQPRGGHFPVRNRIISGLSLGVLVAEAAQNSGSLITARLAGEQGKVVFALPGPIGQPTFTGCHKLIKEGASLVENAEDIVAILRYDFAREVGHIPDPQPVKADEEIDSTEIKTKKPKRKKAKAHNKSDELGVKSVVPSPKQGRRKRPSAVVREEIQLNDDESLLMAILDRETKVHIDSFGRELEWASAKVSKVLLILEMRGAIQQLPGMWYLAKED